MTGDDLCQELVTASRSGAVVTGPRVVPAAVLRRALLQPPGPGEHPTGQLHLRGVTVDGDLDLRGSSLAVQLVLIECEVLGGLNLLEASLPGLQLDRTTAAWVDGANCVITLEVWLKESAFPAGIDFTDARIGGSMHLDGSSFGPDHRTDTFSVVPRGCPVRMRRLTVGGMLSAPRIDCRGMVDLANSRIGGDLELDSARLVAPPAEGPVPGTALHAPDLRVGGSFTADRGHDRGRRATAYAEPAELRAGSGREPADLLDVTGRLYLPGVTIGGDADLSAARLTAADPRGCERRSTGPSGDAEFDPVAVLVLDRAEIRGNLELDNGFTAHGSLRLSKAEIGGDLRFDRSTLGLASSIGAYAMVADGAVVRGHVTGGQALVTGEICLRDARIQHNVYLPRATVHAPGANALNLHRARVGGTVDCGGMIARGSLRLADMSAGSVFVSGASLADPCRTDPMIYQPGAGEQRHDPVLNLIGAEITGTVRGNPAGEPFRAHGTVAVRGARISRSVQFIRAEIVTGEGRALDASSLSCADLYLGGIDTVGAIRFADARISGAVDLTGAQVRWNPEAATVLRDEGRPVASIDGGAAEIGGDAWFDDTRAEGQVRLRRANVRGSVGLRGIVLGEPSETDSGLLVLDLAGLRTPDLVVAPGEPLRGNVDLSRAVVISFTDNANLWRATHLDVFGLEYQVHIDLDARPGTADWHTQIRRFESSKILPPPSTLRTDVALPTGQLSQPYLQLAAVYRATGSDAVARRILFEMRKREWAHRTEPPPGGAPAGRRVRRRLLQLAGFLYRITVGYGYRLQLALYWLIGLWLAGVFVFAVLAPAVQPDPRPVLDATGRTSGCVVLPEADPVAVQPGYCGHFSPALYSLDLLVPVVDLGQKSAWHYRDTGLQVFADILQVAGWILATAAATAALGLVGRADTDRR